MSKNGLRVLIVFLGIFIALPIWGLSGMVLWAACCGITTVLVLDITMLRPFSRRFKLVCLGLYVISMLAVVVWLLTM